MRSLASSLIPSPTKPSPLMSSRTDREAMAAALGGMVSRAEKPSAPTPLHRRQQTRCLETHGASGHDQANECLASPQTSRQRAKEDQSHDQAHRKTGIGYVKADGTEMVRTVVMLTKSERRRLKILALQAGLSPSDYVRRAVGFLDE